MSINQQAFTIIQITYTVALPLFIAWVSSNVKKHSNTNENAKKADMLVLRLCLMDMHDRLTQKGTMTREEFSTFEEIWTLYHDGYGGNLLTDRFREDVKQLPIR